MEGSFDRALADLEAAGRLRQPVEVDPLPGGRARIDGREVLVLCSNDYLGLSQAPELAEAVAEGARRWGVGATGSRLITGTLPVHREAEARLAELVGMEAAILFPSGYQANVGAITSVVGPGDCVISDSLNHASIIDGCRLSRAQVRVVSHRNLDSFDQALADSKGNGNTWIVTEALFSMDGDEADLAGLAEVARRRGARLLVDEAHSLGVLGPRGGGLCQAAGVVPDVLVGTLGKAFGCAGAFVAGSRSMARWLENRARSYVFTTGIAPPLAAAAIAAAELVGKADGARARVLELALQARRELAARGLSVPGRAPILPIMVAGDERVMGVSQGLLERGIFVQGIRPPTVPPGSSRLRLTVSAAHAPEQVLSACSAVGDAVNRAKNV
jgi:8-amino-7-oxononanoate synthase